MAPRDAGTWACDRFLVPRVMQSQPPRAKS